MKCKGPRRAEVGKMSVSWGGGYVGFLLQGRHVRICILVHMCLHSGHEIRSASPKITIFQAAVTWQPGKKPVFFNILFTMDPTLVTTF